MDIRESYAWKTTASRLNCPLLPRNIRGLIIGKSNCGKTTLLLNLLLQPGWLDYNHLYVFGKSLHQKEYQILKKGFEEQLSKRQITNLFCQQDVLAKANFFLYIHFFVSGTLTSGSVLHAIRLQRYSSQLRPHNETHIH